MKSIIDRFLHPNYGTCGCCKMTWYSVDGHSTPYAWSGDEYISQTPDGKLSFSKTKPKDVPSALIKSHPVRLMFPLCETCWGKLTPSQRLPYYRALWEEWNKGEKVPGKEYANWNDIEKSVLEGN